MTVTVSDLREPFATHRSARDGWQVGPAVGAAVVLAWSAAGALRSGSLLRAAGGLVLLALALLVTWSFWRIEYQLTAREILARSGPRLWRVPLEGIVRVYPARSPTLGPAGSIDHLHIDYLCHGKRGRLLLSPEDKFAFLADLALLCPWLHVEGDRAMRKNV
jgi:hypothetical protein